MSEVGLLLLVHAAQPSLVGCDIYIFSSPREEDFLASGATRNLNQDIGGPVPVDGLDRSLGLSRCRTKLTYEQR
jgi:hypothetical protein